MKRLHSPDVPEQQKRSKSALAWLGTALQQLKQLSSAESWHAAKQLVAEHSVEISAYVEDVQQGHVCISGHVAASDNGAAFPHMRFKSEAASTQRVSVQLCLHPKTGLLLDADTSCCPGGFQSVLGSFCPYAVAALLQVAKQAQAPSQGTAQTMEGLPTWLGSSLADVLRSQGGLTMSSSSSSTDGHRAAEQQQQQQGLRTVHDALVAHPTCFTSGLGLDAWQYEGCVTATATVHVASQRNTSVYGYTGGTRPNGDPDKLNLIEDAGEDLATHPWFQNVSYSAMQQQIVLDQPAEPKDALSANPAAAGTAGGEDGAAAAANLPADIRRTLVRAGITVVGVPAATLWMYSGALDAELGAPGAAAASAAAAAHVAPSVARRRLLSKAVKQWLSTYGGEEVLGWQNRPKVINDAFDLLVGCDGSQGRPLSALVLLLRGLWEYLHHHGLGRLLAKPLKLLLALRSVMLVGVFPLWVRKAVCCQLELWEQGLLWQNAATPLDASGGHVGLVHLLRLGKEVHQLCWHHWDEPHLAKLLAEAFAEQLTGNSGSNAAEGASSSAGVGGAAAWAAEPSSLLQLRLQALDAIGASAAYLELAMAGGAWREAIDRLLKSKERFQLLKAVKLLTRHITSLPERLRYMSTIVQLDSLGAPERLEVTARLLLDLREQLYPVQHAVKGGSRIGRHNMAAGPMWTVTLYSLHENPAVVDSAVPPNRIANAAAATQQHRDHLELQGAWSKFVKLFLQTAAEALFKAGEGAIKAHKDHLKEEGLQDDEPDTDQDPEAAAAAAAVVAAKRREEAERQREARVTRFFCPSCNRVHDHEERLGYPNEPPILTPQPGDPDWKLLDIDDVLFGGAAASTLGAIPSEVISGQLTQRTPAGYITEQRIIDAYKKVVPVEFPQLVSLCGLDALCISSIATKLMEDFDAGGKLDTSLGIEPLRELLSHPVVEMGPGTVRLQAAIEAVVYASTMTPLHIKVEGPHPHEGFYRELVWQLLGVGQRSLALLASRARYKVAPSAKAAGELLEVAISCGPEAQAAAVDLILGKGCVRPLGPEDDSALRELEGKTASNAAAPAAGRPSVTPPPGLTPAELQLLLRREAGGMDYGMEDHLPPHLRYQPDYMSDEDSEFYDSDLEYDMMYGSPPYSPMLDVMGPLQHIHRELRAAEAALAEGANGVAIAVAADRGVRAADFAVAAVEQLMARGGTPEARGEVDAMSISSGADDGGSDGVISISSDASDCDDDDSGEGAAGRAVLTPAEAEAAAVAAETAAAAAAADYRSKVAETTRLAQGVGTVTGVADQMLHARNAAADAMARQQLTVKHAAKLRRAADKAAGGAPKRRRGLVSSSSRAAAGSSAAAIAAAAEGTSAAAAGRGQPGRGSHSPHHPAAEPDDSDGLGSFDTRELLGSDAAAVLQLKDTASSRGAPAAAAAAGADAAAGDPAAAAARGGGAARLFRELEDDDDDLDGPYYGRPPRPVRNIAPAQNAPRPARRPSKPRAAAAAAAAGGTSRGGAAGGGGGGGDDDGGGDGGPSHGGRGHKGGGRRHHRPNSRNRRSGSLDGHGDPQQQILMSELFGVSHATHVHPLRTLRVHLHRLAALQLWSVAKYAAGRGVDQRQLKRLGMAAWLSDGNSASTNISGQVLRMSEALRWTPVASDQAGWLEATQQLRTVVNNTSLQAPNYEPWGGVSTAGRSWSGLPCGSWDSFTAQASYPTSYNSARHDTPDANLAWLMAVLADPPQQQQQQQQVQQVPTVSPGQTSHLDQMLATSKAALEAMLVDRKDRVAAAATFLALRYQGNITGYTYREGPKGKGYYSTAQPDTTGAQSAAAAGSSGGDAAGSSKAAAAAGSSCAGGSNADVALADKDAEADDYVTDVLQKLAHLSKGIRFGLPMLQLCHALMEAGCRDPCLALLPQALLPAGGTILSLQLQSNLVTDIEELLPLVAKHGDSGLRVGAAVSFMLVTRKVLPAPLISQPDILSGVVAWWLGLSSVLHLGPDDWTASSCYTFVKDYFTSLPHIPGSGSWPQLQRMLVTSILASLGGAVSRSSIPQAGVTSSSDPNVLPATEGYQLLLHCETVKSAHWAFRLYLARLCYQTGLAPTWPQLSGLLCPGLVAAVAAHAAGWAPGEGDPLTDMKAWKEHRGARQLPSAACRARDWVAETLEWLATDVLAGQDRHTGSQPWSSNPSGSGMGGSGADRRSISVFLGAGPQATPQDKERLRAEFVDTMSATLSGWCGPELLLLAAAVRPTDIPTFVSDTVTSPHHGRAAAVAAAAATAAAQAAWREEQQQEQLRSLTGLMQSGLLPLVGRADELSVALCVRRGQYRSALRVLMGDRALLAVLPVDLLRCLALTYWQQEATPESFLKANEVLLRLEGSAAAQTLALPSRSRRVPAAPATGSAPAAAAAAGSAGSSGDDMSSGPVLAAGLKSLQEELKSYVHGGSAAAAVLEGDGGWGVGGEAGAGMPQVHAVLLEQLDLVPSKGGIEAAGLRFMQLQRHAAKGHYDAALESIFSNDSSSSNSSNAGADGASLSGHMEVVDAVLRLAADASSNSEALRSLMCCPPYQATVGLESLVACSEAGTGPALLASLLPDMRANVLKLCIWRLVRAILQRPPSIELRKSLGPSFVSTRSYAGDMAYNRGNPPTAPSYITPQVQSRWSQRCAFSTLVAYCEELGLSEGQARSAQFLAARLCEHMEQQELALLWAIQRLAALQTGPQLESSLVGLTTSAERSQLERLPVLMMGLGELVKRDRGIMWAYAALKHSMVAEKITRYIRRNVGDVATLQRYLTKSTIAEIQGYKTQSIPWSSWELGTKAAQAQELAEWLYWLQVTWPNLRAAAGVAREAPSLYTFAGRFSAG